MNKHRLFISAAAAALAAAVLASCAPKPPSDGSAASPSQAASSVPSVSSGTGAEAPGHHPLITDPNINEPGAFPVVKEKATLTLGIPQNANVTSYAYGENGLTTLMEDYTNVHLELEMFPATDADQKLELMISSNAPLPDMLWGFSLSNDIKRFSYGQAGAIIPLNEYYDSGLAIGFDKYAAQSEIYTPEEFKAYTTSPDGKIYGLIDFVVSIQNHYPVRSWLNHQWLDNLGLGAPTTQEELVAVLRAFRDRDANGNGDPNDEIPMIGSVDGWNANVLLYLMNQYIYVPQQAFARNSEYFYTIQNGTLDVPYDKEEWREGLRFAKSLVDEKLLSTLSFTQDNTQYNALAASEPSVVGLGVSGSIGGFGNNIQYYEALDAIEGPTGQRNVSYAPQFPSVNLAVTRDCKNPALAFLWAQAAYDNADIYVTMYNGVKDQDWEWIPEGDDAKGMYESMGYPATIRILNPVWGAQNQSCWNGGPMPNLGTYAAGAAREWDGNENNNEYKNAKAVMKLDPYKPDPSILWPKVIYTAEEIDRTAMNRATLNEYIREAMARFVMGEIDLDKDWDKYLKELESLQYKELMEIDQQAYDRTMRNAG